ncbi:MAG: nuclear transport factor 2 family protein, partial [Bacteroidota bacterium]
YDSYGDALAENGKLPQALENYRKAVQRGTQTNHPNLSSFRANLANAESQMLAESTQTSEEAGITATLMDYIEGTAHGEPDRLRKAFHPAFHLYTVTPEGNLRIREGEAYINLFQVGERHERVGRILSIDYENDAAVAKVEVVMPNDRVYIDYFLLLKYEGSWKIVHKSYTKRM